MNIKILDEIKQYIADKDCTLVAVTKTHPVPVLQEAYDAGLREFGENKVQEMVQKQEEMPKDILWHMIGHLQSNKVKYIAPFVHLIQSVDSESLLKEINKQALRNNRVIDCLLQIHIAEEETKFGLDFSEAQNLLISISEGKYPNISVKGLMGMASNTSDAVKVRKEFRSLRHFFETMKKEISSLTILSMGMSGDYKIAVEEGSNLIRVGSALFGDRNYKG